MFTESYRQELKDTLITRATNDEHISGVALTGSASIDLEDPWSDIDLALGVRYGTEVADVINDWTTTIYNHHGAVDHLDVARGNTTYRVFLLSNSLQVDIAFSPEAEFGAVGPSFRLLSGEAVELPQPPVANAESVIGMAWLYALHARSSLARGRFWQAEYMISGIRDEVLSLACLRHGLPWTQGRGLHDLPSDVAAPLEETLVRTLDQSELVRAFVTVTEIFIKEVGHHDEYRASRLGPVIRELVRSANA
jgi:hypothetical protein